MARNAAALMRGATTVLSSVARRRRSFVAAAAIALLSAGCGQSAPRQEQFVGKWKSSRLATPLHMYKNGEWEIRTEEDSVLQFGVWQLDGRRIVWSIKMEGRLDHEENAVLSVGQRRFELRERDGSVTVFERLD
jgi:hypothetical protein